MEANFFEVGGDLRPTIGRIREHLNTPINITEYVELLSRAEIQKIILTDELPLPDPADREGYYGPRHLEYWLSGYADFLKVKQLGKFANLDGLRVLDFGGCTGRVIRHFMMQTRAEPWLCDINVNYITWLLRHFPKSLKCYRNDYNPSLPVADNFFDIVCAYSVFSHLDAFELAWLLEVHRVLKPGGKAFLTILDENSWQYAGDHDWLMQSILKGNFDELSGLMKSGMPTSRFPIKYSDAVAYNCNIFLRSDYVNEVWGRFFSSIELSPLSHNYQCVVALTK